LDDKKTVILGGMGIIAAFVLVSPLFKLNSILIVVASAMLLLVLTSAVNLCANETKWSETPFGLPKGTIRASITLIFIIIVVLGAFNINNVGAIAKEMPEWLLAILGTIIGFYFGERKGADEDEAAESAKKEKLKSDAVAIYNDTTMEDKKKATELLALIKK
jgi:hypothetical protein